MFYSTYFAPNVLSEVYRIYDKENSWKQRLALDWAWLEKAG